MHRQMETLTSSLQPQITFPILHASDVSAARRAGQKLADSLGFAEVQAGRLAIVITEAGTNILKHASEGTLYIMPTHSNAETAGIDVLAVDSGPGIGDIETSLRDGVSTAGTAGTGLGALHRQADEFDVWTARGQGAAFFMRLWSTPAPPAPSPLRSSIEVGALCVPLAGEDESGDGWAVSCNQDGASLLGVDGLGHGPEAHKAAAGAIAALERRPAAAPAETLHAAHEALRVTRGAALSVARIDFSADQLHFAGIGNVNCVVVDGESRRAMVSHNGIVGNNMRKVQEFSVACPPGALVILHSDGIQTQWDLKAYPGLVARTPAIVAGILMRDFIRRRDDAMVLVGRRTGGYA
jgi:anti-sigma regulatory factor (Ser/Thr protein kinase)